MLDLNNRVKNEVIELGFNLKDFDTLNDSVKNIDKDLLMKHGKAVEFNSDIDELNAGGLFDLSFDLVNKALVKNNYELLTFELDNLYIEVYYLLWTILELYTMEEL